MVVSSGGVGRLGRGYGAGAFMATSEEVMIRGWVMGHGIEEVMGTS